MARLLVHEKKISNTSYAIRQTAKHNTNAVRSFVLAWLALWAYLCLMIRSRPRRRLLSTYTNYYIFEYCKTYRLGRYGRAEGGKTYSNFSYFILLMVAMTNEYYMKYELIFLLLFIFYYIHINMPKSKIIIMYEVTNYVKYNKS